MTIPHQLWLPSQFDRWVRRSVLPQFPWLPPSLSSIQESSIPTASIVQSHLDPVFYNILLSPISTPTL